MRSSEWESPAGTLITFNISGPKLLSRAEQEGTTVLMAWMGLAAGKSPLRGQGKAVTKRATRT